MLDHIGLPVADYARSKRFYEHVLATLGYGLVMEVTPAMTGGDESHAGFGLPRRPQFWISSGEALRGRLHVCFEANTRAQVRAFHVAALAAGARELLRRLRARPGWPQHRSRLPHAGRIRDLGADFRR
jgi:catechol 2,3-dioxygenase-like lactoylglutathione lyase family enzyme